MFQMDHSNPDKATLVVCRYCDNWGQVNKSPRHHEINYTEAMMRYTCSHSRANQSLYISNLRNRP